MVALWQLVIHQESRLSPLELWLAVVEVLELQVVGSGKDAALAAELPAFAIAHKHKVRIELLKRN